MGSKDDVDVLFSSGGGHDIRVTVLLNADEFIFVRDLSSERGISASSFFRQMVNDERRRIAQEKLSADKQAANTSQPTQELNNILIEFAKFMKAKQ